MIESKDWNQYMVLYLSNIKNLDWIFEQSNNCSIIFLEKFLLVNNQYCIVGERERKGVRD